MITNLIFRVRDSIETSPAKRDRLVLISLIAAGIMNLASWLIVPAFFWNFKEYAVLQYNIYFGISSLGPWMMLMLFPLLALVFSAINFSLSLLFFLKDKLLCYYLAVSAAGINLISLCALILIIYINL